MHYLLFYEKAPDHAEREPPYRAAHLAHVQAAVDRGELLLGGALADQTIGFEEEQDGIWRINFMDLDLGFLDEQTMKFTPISPEDSHQRLSSPSRERN